MSFSLCSSRSQDFFNSNVKTFYRYSRNQEYGPQKYVAARQDPERGFLPNYGGTLSDLLEYSSGSTLPSLVQQTIARQIQVYSYLINNNDTT